MFSGPDVTYPRSCLDQSTDRCSAEWAGAPPASHGTAHVARAQQVPVQRLQAA